ncbi:molybdopterin-dependent oxidoreductase [Brevibacterium aurantiacum]|uniref:DMSO/TMAO reductase YedYZ, molybdopterin-dependent catalytic subunit n=1 Tax=Brevibacterium aurantiacum TaxID=273384 RepID=A0A2A3ZA30_BREAU|nr:molybdopterin-dependent oxidoreductase [Brevibacterium aurantiacum]MDN5585443.1 molybdopterin-dependent oxidoreductase [Brevibacterium sp.]PCC18101.1 oxidoreductase [Brevibacterium aurantiacum]PCC48862.1 oxidoreductase [Brevibacterium aurantiacum]SMX96782.1 DMSO/TMAO reductase YedYZ, molybdopterin-dependent catalytic subunit [Brevibacterium aurantiacum]
MRTPLRAALAGVVATLVLFSAADLIARAFGPPSAPLLALGQTIIPLAPAGLIKPVIDLLGHNDKLFLILTTGLGALVLGGLIGRLAFRRLRMATVLLSAAGLVPVLVILIRAESSVVDIIPTLIGLALGLLVFRLLIAAGAGQPTLRSGQPTLRSGEADGGRTESGQSPATPSRRRFFVITGVIGAAGAAAVAAGQTVASLTLDAGAAVAKLVLPKPATTAPPIPASAHPEVKGLAPFVTDPKDFYRIDTALAPPVVDPQEWSMRIHGMVESEVTLTMDDLLDLPLDEHHITLTCVSNPVGGDLVGNATWLGFPVRELLQRAKPHEDADMVLSHSIDGFTASTPIEALSDDRNALLAVGMNGSPLPPEHGFPARLVVPGLYGFVSATKWVTELEVTRFDEKTAYWTDRGWDAKAPILVASRIEVPKPLGKVPAGDITVAGTAWAQRSGVKRVDVKLDDGGWTSADLAEAVNIDTWRQWRADFSNVGTGSHTLTVRAIDQDGNVQTPERREAIPNSATGHHHIQFRVE